MLYLLKNKIALLSTVFITCLSLATPVVQAVCNIASKKSSSTKSKKVAKKGRAIKGKAKKKAVKKSSKKGSSRKAPVRKKPAKTKVTPKKKVATKTQKKPAKTVITPVIDQDAQVEAAMVKLVDRLLNENDPISWKCFARQAAKIFEGKKKYNAFQEDLTRLSGDNVKNPNAIMLALEDHKDLLTSPQLKQKFNPYINNVPKLRALLALRIQRNNIVCR